MKLIFIVLNVLVYRACTLTRLITIDWKHNSIIYFIILIEFFLLSEVPGVEI